MTGFDAGWLDLREPVDAVSRDPDLIAAAADFLGGVAAPMAVDLGCGTGSNLRAFAARAPKGLHWRLVDHDPRLLEIAAARCGPSVEVLARDISDPTAIPLEGARLVTASALFDLVSGEWIEALAERVVAAGVGLHASLIYDGFMHWTPWRPEDDAIRHAFNAHQRGDKGFGPALGPEAVAAVVAAFERRGYVVRLAESPWRIEPQRDRGQAALHAALVDGIAAAAAETGLGAARGWGQARRASSGTSVCRVGHADILALPAGARAQSNRTSAPRP